VKERLAQGHAAPRRLAWWIGALLVLAAEGRAADAAAQASGGVPDVVARQSGLRLAPMSRPARTYAANCQGCHGHRGVSVAEIPPLAGRIGYFVRIPEGRNYLVQVPNVAMNASSDQDIAEVLNWALTTFSREQLPADFRPYTASEVSALRSARIEPTAVRPRIVAELLAAGQIPSADVLAIVPAPVH
jgi:mono/diheme cytochrome c family protein